MDIIIRPDEKIIKVFRKSKGEVNSLAVAFVLILAGLIIFRWKGEFNLWGYWNIGLGLVSGIFILCFTIKWMVWMGYMLIVTNQRVVFVDRKGVFNKIVTELLFRDINKISYEVEGIGALLSLGVIRIETGHDNEIIIRKISNPREVVDVINTARSKTK